jgi:hypothetical protein
MRDRDPLAELAELAASQRAAMNRSALADRIRAMASRWQYAPDELAEALKLAENDPAGWLCLVEHDKKLNAQED